MPAFKDIMDYLYSPLSRQYCLYYYILMVLAFIVFVFVFAGAFSRLIAKTGSSSFRGMLKGIVALMVISLPLFIGYFQTRMMYSMCDASLK